MTESNFEKAFQEIMVNEAARDRYLRGTVEWLMLGVTSLVSDEFLDIVDEAQLRADIGQYYALDEEGVQRAYEMCEDDITKGVVYGEA